MLLVHNDALGGIKKGDKLGAKLTITVKFGDKPKVREPKTKVTLELTF